MKIKEQLIYRFPVWPPAHEIFHMEKTELFKTQIKTSSKATIGLKPRG